MSLSMPTTSKPCSWKNLAVSLPMRPDEPVTMTTLTSLLLRVALIGSWDQTGKALLIGAHPLRDVFDNRLWATPGRPAEQLRHLGVVGDVPGNIDRAGGRVLRDGRLSAYGCAAQSGVLLQRYGTVASAAHVERPARHLAPRSHLRIEQVAQVVRMQQVAHLKSFAAKAG